MSLLTLTRRLVACAAMATIILYFFTESTSGGGLLPTFISSDKISLFHYHVLGCSVAFTLVAPEAIYYARAAGRTPRGGSGSSSSSAKASLVDVHALVAFLMAIGGIGGFAAITISKNQSNKPHYTSSHGQGGLFTITLLTLTVTLGVLHKNRIIANVRRTHALVALTTCVMGSCSVFYGLTDTKGGKAFVPDTSVRMVLGLAPSVLMAAAYFTP